MNREQSLTQAEIIQMAREADLIYWRPYANFKDGIWWMDEGEPDERLERFAKLVAEHEREACHALRQTLPNPYDHCQVSAHAYDMAISAYGAAIRARGDQA